MMLMAHSRSALSGIRGNRSITQSMYSCLDIGVLPCDFEMLTGLFPAGADWSDAGFQRFRGREVATAAAAANVLPVVDHPAGFPGGGILQHPGVGVINPA